MALYINKKEAIHRISNGFLSHDGYVNGQFFDIYKRNGIDVYEVGNARLLNCIAAILDSMDDEGIEIYPKELRGTKIRDIRKSQDRSASWVAIKAGLSKSCLYKIENGDAVPRQSTLVRIANVLHVKVEDLG